MEHPTDTPNVWPVFGTVLVLVVLVIVGVLLVLFFRDAWHNHLVEREMRLQAEAQAAAVEEQRRLIEHARSLSGLSPIQRGPAPFDWADYIDDVRGGGS